MANSSHASDDNQTKTFKTFPEFSKLTLADRERYEELIKDYPPISDISFATLMLWWNQLGSLAISLLNGNLVISYWLPGDERRSGLSLIGKHNVDESLCTIFDYLQERNEAPRIIQVPEFVVSHMHHPELFRFEGERTLDEYIIPIDKFYPLSHVISYRRHRIRKFLSGVDEGRISVRSIDLSQEENRSLLLDSVKLWPKKGTINAPSKMSEEALHASVAEAEQLGIENVCLFVGGTLHAFLLYQSPADKRYVIFAQAKLSYELPFLFDYVAYAFAKWFAERGVTQVNLDVDFGIPMFRIIKLALGPQNFFRKYTVEPAR